MLPQAHESAVGQRIVVVGPVRLLERKEDITTVGFLHPPHQYARIGEHLLAGPAQPFVPFPPVGKVGVCGIEAVVVVDEVDGTERTVALDFADDASDAVAIVIVVFLIEAHAIRPESKEPTGF